MADIRRFGPTDFLFLLLILAVAAGARAGYLLRYADSGHSAGPLAVQDPRGDELTSLLDNVQQRQSFAGTVPFGAGNEATAHTSPGYPYLVGLLGSYVGEQRDHLVRWIQVGLGGLTAVLYYLFARRCFRSLAVGVVTGFATALNPFWIINVAEIDDGVLSSFTLAGSLFLAGQTGEKGGALKSLLLGVSLAAVALVRAALLPFSFVVLIWFLLRSSSLSRGWLCALCAFLGFGNGLAPWAVRNYQLFNEPVPVVSSAYLHLWIGNNPAANGGPLSDEMLPFAPGDELRGIGRQTERYARLGKEVREEVRARPVSTLRRRVQAAIAFLFGQRWVADGSMAQVSATANESAEEVVEAAPMALLAFLVGMLALAFLGWRWSYGWRWESIPAALAILWVPLPYILSHAEALSGPRLPLDGVLICFAAFALCCLVPGVNGTLLDAPDAGTAKPVVT